MTAATIVPERQEGGGANTAFIHAAIVIIVGVFATTLSQPQVLGRLPITNLLKNELHVSRTAVSAFFFWAGLAWYMKPLAGIVTDAFPVLGSRRKVYILASGGLTVLAWVGLYFTPHRYDLFLIMATLINALMVMASTVIGAYMVETAQAVAGTGRLTALRQFVQQICGLINGPSAGYLGSIAFGFTAAACGGVIFLIIPVTIFFLHEQRKRIETREMLANAGRQLVRIGNARTMWAAAGLMFLFYAAPGFATAAFFRQQNELHMNTQGQGLLSFCYAACGILAALSYAYACRRLSLRLLLVICLIAGALGNLSFLFYTSVGNARIIHGLDGFGYTLAELVLMDLAVRATPRGSEGLGFALMISVRNLTIFGTDLFGSNLMDHYHLPFNSLVLANGATTLFAVPFIFLLPRILVRRRDAELYEEAPEPVTAQQ
jgi:MFS family permease